MLTAGRAPRLLSRASGPRWLAVPQTHRQRHREVNATHVPPTLSQRLDPGQYKRNRISGDERATGDVYSYEKTAYLHLHAICPCRARGLRDACCYARCGSTMEAWFNITTETYIEASTELVANGTMLSLNTSSDQTCFGSGREDAQKGED
ncbi:uncharacterized protein PHACADRAFT_251362 [Phanerochaete carnosa HHB-10118-sp]|uniref:Uncharacterized protein n=1 Tax=Phanerochaete carnosa (strain HHB-10118-sp) TaxID=650164 RepID=K5WEX0_PHACS|nr:uncharacterized protein PHACADRAFT_251362 [Phanerochaete carnosa HHB-10118-sp]EKM57629.1 hypothetical protein PHACADRAFT_251362 [Phanerochaete carnosa HHB-10118-sp]